MTFSYFRRHLFSTPIPFLELLIQLGLNILVKIRASSDFWIISDQIHWTRLIPWVRKQNQKVYYMLLPILCYLNVDCFLLLMWVFFNCRYFIPFIVKFVLRHVRHRCSTLNISFKNIIVRIHEFFFTIISGAKLPRFLRMLSKLVMVFKTRNIPIKSFETCQQQS